MMQSKLGKLWMEVNLCLLELCDPWSMAQWELGTDKANRRSCLQIRPLFGLSFASMGPSYFVSCLFLVWQLTRQPGIYIRQEMDTVRWTIYSQIPVGIPVWCFSFLIYIKRKKMLSSNICRPDGNRIFQRSRSEASCILLLLFLTN